MPFRSTNKLAHLLLLLFCLFLPAVAEIVELTDATFEHQTQASSGMTTGSWFILFKAERCQHCKKITPHFEKLATDESIKEAGIVLATVNVPSNRGTTVRFDIRGFPTLIYLHQGRLYRFRGKDRSFEGFKKFVLSPPLDKGQDIRPPPSAWTEILWMFQAMGAELWDAARGKSGTAGMVMVALTSILCFIVFGLVAICFLPARPSSSFAPPHPKNE